MPQNINQPSNRITLTNISLVRYRKRKSRFELACYKNKLLEYRSGTETQLDNVLQIPTIFLNVSKGLAAPTSELEKCFGKAFKREEVVAEILAKGEIQVGAGERREERERLEREVWDLVSGRLVDPATGRVYTVGIIRKALEVLSQAGGQRGGDAGLGVKLGSLDLGVADEGDADDEGAAEKRHKMKAGGGKQADKPMWTGVVTTKSAKSQALEAMKALIAWQPIPVMRARMRLRVTCPSAISKQAAKSKSTTITTTITTEAADEDDGDQPTPDPHPPPGKNTIKDRILSFIDQIESQDLSGEEWELVGFVEPGAFKGLAEFVGAETKGRGRVEVLDLAVTHED